MNPGADIVITGADVSCGDPTERGLLRSRFGATASPYLSASCSENR